jgi:hypothetical protein
MGIRKQETKDDDDHQSRAQGLPRAQVADLKLAEVGRKEILLAEQEMPGLMAVRREYAAASP